MKMTMRMIFLATAVISCPTLTVDAESTNSLSDAEIQGRALAQKILEQRPAENSTNTGVLEIRDGHGKRVEIPVEFEVITGATDWRTIYSTRMTNVTNDDPAFGRVRFSQLTVIHSDDHPNQYQIPNVNPPPTETNFVINLAEDQITLPFAQSDFWYCDLGLEFFHWPLQKVIKKEFHRNCPCTVLESTNPHPSTNGYSRVVCWIDEDSLGIVEAYAYDVNGKKLKNFYPKNLEKVNGQYQVQTMIMENLLTGSRSRLDFDLNN